MVLGAYFLTYCTTTSAIRRPRRSPSSSRSRASRRFASEEEIEFALEDPGDAVSLQQPIEYRSGDELRLTTPGRVIFETEIERSLRDAVRDRLHEPLVVDRALTSASSTR